MNTISSSAGDRDWEAARRRVRTSWTCVARVSELEPESFRPVELDGVALLISRDRAGTVRGFHNVCSHRGHALAEGGCRRGPRISCPYHGWSYGADGSLKSTPHIGGAGVHQLDGFDPRAHGLKPVAVATWWDFVLVNLDGQAAPIAEWVAALEARWQPYLGDAGVQQFVPTRDEGFALDVQGAWTLAVENYCESYHLPFVHPQLNTYSRIEDHYTIACQGRFAGQGTRVFEPRYLGEACLPSLESWPHEHAAVAEYVALFPNLLLGVHRDHAFSVILHAQGAERTLEQCNLYFPAASADSAEHASARERTREAWIAVFEEDVPVVEGMQRGRRSPGYDGGAFSPVLETGSMAFYDWLHEVPSAGAVEVNVQIA